MGYEIVYCASCASQVRGADLEKRLAIRVDDLAYCAKCAPGVLKTLPQERVDEILGRVPPPVRKTSTTRIPKIQQTKTSGRLKAQPAAAPPPPPPPPPQQQRKGLLLGSAAGAAVLVVLVAVLMSRSPAPEPVKEKPVEAARPAAAASRPKPAENLAAAQALVDLEQLASSGADPLEILIRCDEIKGVVRGTPQEAKWREIQARALEAKKTKDADQAITRGLEQVRSLRRFDARYAKKAEIDSLLERMRQMGGPRQAEVQAVREAYAKEADEALLRFKDLQAWYRFTIVERLGVDDSGRDNHASGTTGVRWNGENGGARFEGNGVLGIPVAVRDDFTLAMWVRTKQPPSGTSQWFEAWGLVDAEMPGVTEDFGTAVLRGKFSVGVGNPDTTLASRSSVNDGRWHHVAATRSSATGALKVYVDGADEGSAAGPTGPRTAPSRMAIGGIQTGTNPFVGEIDDVRIYSRVLTGPEIAALARRPEGK